MHYWNLSSFKLGESSGTVLNSDSRASKPTENSTADKNKKVSV